MTSESSTIGNQRIVFVCSADFSAPSEKVALGFSLELVRRGARILLLINGDPASIDLELGEDRPPGLEVHDYGFRFGRLDPDTKELVRRFDPTIVHAYNPRLPVVTAVRGLIDERTPVVVNFEDDEWGLMRLHSGPWPRLPLRVAGRIGGPIHPAAWPYATAGTLKWARDRGDVFHAITPELAREVEQVMRRQCEILLPVHPGLGPGDHGGGVVPLPDSIGDRPLVTFTGAIYGAQADDFRLLLEAMGRLVERGSDAVLVFAGSAAGRFDLRAWAAESGVPDDRFVMTGYLNFRDMWALLGRSDVLVQPGAPTEFNRLRLPSKLQAYLSSGTPTVTFGAGAGELFEDGTEVLKTFTAHPAELADAIQRILDEPELRAKLAEGGPRAAERLFGLARNTDRLVEIYEKALEGAKHAHGPRAV